MVRGWWRGGYKTRTEAEADRHEQEQDKHAQHKHEQERGRGAGETADESVGGVRRGCRDLVGVEERSHGGRAQAAAARPGARKTYVSTCRAHRPDGAELQEVEEAREEFFVLQRDSALQEGDLHGRAVLQQLLQQVAHLHRVLLVDDVIAVQNARASLKEGLHAARHAPSKLVAPRAAPPAMRERQAILARRLGTCAWVAAVHLAQRTHVRGLIKLVLLPPLAQRQERVAARARTILTRPRLGHRLLRLSSTQ